ncbi:MAG TPA: protein kinase [Vicinamibacteria bacterium]|nr:protein kinase [Vicinamibacteria bacterium]
MSTVTEGPALGEEGRGPGLATQFFVGAAFVIAVTVGLSVALASGKAESVARERIRSELQRVPALFAGWRDSQMSARRAQVRAVAEQPGTKALLAERGAGPETAHDTSLEFARALGAGAVFLFDTHGALIERTDRPGDEAGRDFSGVAWVSLPLARLTEASAFIAEMSHGPALSLVASAPVLQGAGTERVLNGVLAAAFRMDDQRARELARLAGGEAAFLVNAAARGAVPRLEVVGTTEAFRDPGLARAVSAQSGSTEAQLAQGDLPSPFELSAGGRDYLATLVPILSGSGEPVGGLVVGRSKDVELAALREIRRSLLGVGALILILCVPLSFAFSRALARPIHQLAQGAEEIGRGNLDVSLPPAGRGEVGALTRAFEVMRRELKEKSQLELMVADLRGRGMDPTMRGLPPTGPDGLPKSGPAIGHLFAQRYEIRGLVGRGGMGSVYRALDRELDEEVALKVLEADGGDASAEQQLRREIKLARTITHSNVIRAYDFGEADGVRFFTMEYVAGATLRELLDEGGRLALTPALQIAKQVCRGLGAVHRAGIVHGDLKPANIVVMTGGVAKLTDFGVARGRRQAGTPFAGTPPYMSPEQVRGADLDERSDLYSTGVVMFEMFTGRRPFDAGDPFEVMRLHLEEPPPNPRTFQSNLPDLLADTIVACLAKAKADRPATAADLDRLLMRVRA